MGAADAAVRAAGAGAFLLAQDRAGAWPLVPLRRGLPAAAVADALDGGRTVAVARVSDATPWPRGGTRVIQRSFNVRVPRAIVPEKGSTRRERSER